MRLLLVYNADGGPLNAVLHTVHRLLAPATYDCRLCALTHSPVAMRRRWKAYLNGLGVPLVILHRDVFARRYPALGGRPLPAILADTGPSDPAPHVLLSAETIAACADLDALIAALDTALANRASASRAS